VILVSKSSIKVAPVLQSGVRLLMKKWWGQATG